MVNDDRTCYQLREVHNIQQYDNHGNSPQFAYDVLSSCVEEANHFLKDNLTDCWHPRLND